MTVVICYQALGKLFFESLNCLCFWNVLYFSSLLLFLLWTFCGCDYGSKYACCDVAIQSWYGVIFSSLYLRVKGEHSWGHLECERSMPWRQMSVGISVSLESSVAANARSSAGLKPASVPPLESNVRSVDTSSIGQSVIHLGLNFEFE